MTSTTFFLCDNGDILVSEWLDIVNSVCFSHENVIFAQNSRKSVSRRERPIGCCVNVNREFVHVKEKGKFKVEKLFLLGWLNDRWLFWLVILRNDFHLHSSYNCVLTTLIASSGVSNRKPANRFRKVTACFTEWLIQANDNDNENDDAAMVFKASHVSKVYPVEIGQVHGVNHCLIPAITFSDKTLILQAGDVERNPGPDPNGPQGMDAGPARRQDAEVGDRNIQTQACRKKRSELQVVSLNVRGLGCGKKVRHLVNSCYKMCTNAGDSLFMFQETFVPKLDLIRYLWRGEYHLTVGTGNSLGCITLITAPYKVVHSVELGQRGHVLALSKDNPNRVEIVIANAYAPNGFDNDKRTFLDELVDAVVEMRNTYNCRKVVIAGDLNLVLDEKEVKNRVYTGSERRLADDFKIMLEQAELSDGWRIAQPSFTWTSSRTGQQSFSTLDRILFSDQTLTLEQQRADWTFSLSDHAAVIATYAEVRNHDSNSKCNFLPRLDPRLLLDQEGKQIMDETFLEMFGQQSPEWNPHVRLEYCKMCIRTAANAATGKIKARYRDEESQLNSDINSIINDLSNDVGGSDARALLMHKLDDLRQLKRCLVEKIGAKLERRTARKWYNEGELSSKYFFNLMSRKNNDEIKVILNDNGDEITDAREVGDSIRQFYKNLYESVPDQLDINDDLFSHVQPLDPAEANHIGARITIDELEATLRGCSDSAPGPDGIPYSFIKHFWSTFGNVLLDAWNYSLAVNELPPSHKLSYLRLIPKAGKDSRLISNLRPITLSNTDHKLITKTYAKKLTELVMPSIGAEQTAYIPGRLINDNVRAMLMTIDLPDADAAVDGVLVSLDAKKAFDSVDHRYIRRCLEKFGLACFIPIFNTLYKDLSSDIILNGRTISGYNILKGVKQGDALSCILFIICMEPLILNIKHNQTIEEIVSASLPIRVPKVYGYADDVSVATKRTNDSIQSIFTEYETFSRSSGLFLNADKTEVLCFNGARLSNHQFEITYLGARYRLQGLERIKINGIIFQQDPAQRETRNVEKAVDSMDRHLAIWSTRHLTLLGKVLIIKTFAISQIIYLMQSISLSDESLKRINKVVYKYLWNRNFRAAKAPERLKRSIMLTPIRLGGFGMIEINEIAESLDLRAYGRLINSCHPFFSQVRTLINSNDFFNIVINHAVDRKLKKSLLLLNRDRLQILQWPRNMVANSSLLSWSLLDMRLVTILSRPGRLSLHYFAIHTRVPNAKIKDLSSRELLTVARFIVHPNLADLLVELLRVPYVINLNVNSDDVYPGRGHKVLSIAKLSSRDLRQNRYDDEDKLICIYKIGMILDPGEVGAWTNRLRNLTSTRHRNILLRTAHGDIFSNSRLFRFGLKDNPGCSNCPEAFETIMHRLCDCPKAVEAWNKLEEAKTVVGLDNLSDRSINSILGAKGRPNKIELALNAELILKLTTRGEGYDPQQTVRSVIQLIGNSEKLGAEIRDKFKSYCS